MAIATMIAGLSRFFCVEGLRRIDLRQALGLPRYVNLLSFIMLRRRFTARQVYWLPPRTCWRSWPAVCRTFTCIALGDGTDFCTLDPRVAAHGNHAGHEECAHHEHVGDVEDARSGRRP